MPIVADIKELRAYYITEAYGVHRTVKAVDDVSLAIRENEIYGIAGESGCGKSTLLKVLLGMVTPPLTIVSGSVTYDFGAGAIDVLTLSPAELRALRWTEVSYIPQGSMHVLNPVRRIRDTFRDFIGVHVKTTPRETDAMVRRYLADLGLPEKVLGSYPHQLSGGMRQRVGIALALALEPSVVILDEPTTALDVIVEREILEQIRVLQKRIGFAVVFITHDLARMLQFSDRVAVFYAAKLVEVARAADLRTDPRHPYTQGLVRAFPTVHGERTPQSIPGSPPSLQNPPTGCRFHPRCPVAQEICRRETPPEVPFPDGVIAACHFATEVRRSAAAPAH
jgi:peptide/nickel transport system ATP-binding protein